MTLLRSLKGPKGHLARWVNELSQYDFKVHYKSGVDHTDANVLSRRPHSCEDTKQPASLCHPDIVVCQNISIAPSYTNAELANLQRRDPVLRRVIDKLVTSNVCPPPSGPWRSGTLRRYRQIWSQLVIQDGELCRLCSSGDRGQLQLKYFQLLSSTTCYNNVMTIPLVVTWAYRQNSRSGERKVLLAQLLERRC